MASATLNIDLNAIAQNWRALDRLSAPGVQTAGVVKADAYGLGAAEVGLALARAGARRFFVAHAAEGMALRKVLGQGPQIAILTGHLAGATEMIRDHDLTPMLSSLEQITRHLESLPGHPFGVQLDTGMNRLGVKPADWQAIAPILLAAEPALLMSHLACGDVPDHPANETQLAAFHTMTDGTGLPRSLSATGGIFRGPRYHFDLTRPGIGLYGGLPFADATPVVQLSLPVVQIRHLDPGETVGYGCTWVAKRPTTAVTLLGGYADGLPRSLSNRAQLWAGNRACPLIGRVSMDLITVDVTDLPEIPDSLELLGPAQGIDTLAEFAGTISYELLATLGQRYDRQYQEHSA
jgi:alanine racemase